MSIPTITVDTDKKKCPKCGKMAEVWAAEDRPGICFKCVMKNVGNALDDNPVSERVRRGFKK